MSARRAAALIAAVVGVASRTAAAQSCGGVAMLVPNHASTIEALVPADSRVALTAEGDLDGDGMNDVVLVLESRSAETRSGADEADWFSADRTVVVALNTGTEFESVAAASCLRNGFAWVGRLCGASKRGRTRAIGASGLCVTMARR